MIHVYETFVLKADRWVDSHVNPNYPADSTANDCRRIMKLATEVGEVFEEFAQLTGANRRKPQDMDAYPRMLAELADLAVGSILALQHFTKDTKETQAYIDACVSKTEDRMAQYPVPPVH